ncbi:MAG: hypothetical protein JW940_23615 [Polyangiaceae bacterium]|nr:hypothetical protein [Polyangiaceae bacterium]
MTPPAGGDCHGVQINCGVTDNHVIEYDYTASDGTSRVLERKLCRAAFGDASAGKALHIWCDTNNPFPVAIHSDDTVW